MAVTEPLAMGSTGWMLLLAALAFTVIAALTWFYASRRKLFLRTFVAAEDIRDAVRGMPRDDSFRRAMRIVSALQFFVAVGLWLAFLWTWVG